MELDRDAIYRFFFTAEVKEKSDHYLLGSTLSSFSSSSSLSTTCLNADKCSLLSTILNM